MKTMLSLLVLAATAAAKDDEMAMWNGYLSGWNTTIPQFRFQNGAVMDNVLISKVSLSSLTASNEWRSVNHDGRLHLDALINMDLAASLTLKGEQPQDLSLTIKDVTLESLVLNFLGGDVTPITITDAVKADVFFDNITRGDITTCNLVQGEAKKTKQECIDAVDSLITNVRENIRFFANNVAANITDKLTAQNTARNAAPHVVPNPYETVKEQEALYAQYKNFTKYPEIVNMKGNDSSLVEALDFVLNDVYGRDIGKGKETQNVALGKLVYNFIKDTKLPIQTTVWNDGKGSVLNLTDFQMIDLTVVRFAFEPISEFSFMLSATVTDSTLRATGDLNLTSPDGTYHKVHQGNVFMNNIEMDLNITVMAVINATAYEEKFMGPLFPFPSLDTPFAEIAIWLLTNVSPCFLGDPMVGFNVLELYADLRDFNLDYSVGLFSRVSGYPATNAFFEAAMRYTPRQVVYNQDDVIVKEFETLYQAVFVFAFGVIHEPGSCPLPPPSQRKEIAPFDYTTWSLSQIIDFVVNTVVGTDNDYGVNAFLRAGWKHVPEVDAGATYDFSDFFGNLTLGLNNLNLTSFPEVTRMSVLKAKAAEMLDNVITIEDAKVSMDVEIAVTGSDKEDLSDKMTVSIGFDKLDIHALVGVWLNTTKFAWQPFEDATKPGCLASMPLNMTFPDTSVILSGLAVDVVCQNNSCTSPLMEELEIKMSSKDGRALLESQVQDILSQVTEAIKTDKFHDAVLEFFRQQDDICSFGAVQKSEDEGPWTRGKALGLVFGLVGAFALVLTVFAVYMTVKGEPTKQLSLLWHPALPVWQRVGLLVWVSLSAALFLWANLSPGAQVHAVLQVGGSKVTLHKLFTYSLSNTISDFFNGDIYALAILVLMFSGVWPYLKIWLMIFAWVANGNVLSKQHRGRLLELLDFFGKWSLIDAFLMIMMLVSFRMHIFSPERWVYLPKEFVVVDVIVSPCWGLYGFTIAAVLSLTVNHLMVLSGRACDLYDETNGKKSDWFEDPSPERRVLAFHMPADEAHDQKARTVRTVRAWGMILLLLTTLVLLCVGCVVDVFTFDFQGLGAWAVDLQGKGEHSKSYSLITIDRHVYNQMDDDGAHFGYGFLAAVFMIFVLAMPILQFVFLLVLWVAPLTLREQKILFFTNEITAAWCALEVCIVVFIVALLEIGKLAEYMVGDKCDFIDPALEFLDTVNPTVEFMDDYAKKCFGVKSHFADGCWILFAAGILSNVAYYFAWRDAEHLINERHVEAMSSPLSQNSPKDFEVANSDPSPTEKTGLLATSTNGANGTSNGDAKDGEDEKAADSKVEVDYDEF